MTTIIIIALAVCALVFTISTYNTLIVLRNKCHEAFATMDVYLKRRFDIVPQLISTVKAYASHEAHTLEEVVANRNASTNRINERIDQENILTDAIKQVNIVAEGYPELKANENFLNLQQQLSAIETDIAKARRYYNGSVRQYNTRCQTIPSNIVATIAGFNTMKMFEASEKEREINTIA